MRSDRVIDMADFRRGFTALDDTSKADFGSFRVMKNAQVTDRGGIGPRPGTLLIGDKNTSAYAIKGFYNFRKSFETNEILIKAYDDELEGYSKNHTDQGWFRIKDGYTQDKEFGFVHSLFNTNNENYVVGSNRFDPFFAWTGVVMTLNGALAGGETAVTVNSVLRSDIYYSGTATSSSTTTLNVSGTPWAASQWVNFYVKITSGVESGSISKITANTTSQITFDALGSNPGNCTFEVRQLLIPESGTLMYGGTEIAYTDVPTDTTITVASAHAGADGLPVTVVPAEYVENPRGNRLTNFLGRTIIGNVRSALSRDSGGSLQGYASSSSYFVSKLNNPLDFTFSGTRAAGEGDIQATPYGGGDITDVIAQEKQAYIFKRDYIESVSYSQDANDLATREPLKPGIGSVGKVTLGDDDVYFITEGKQFTSLGRVESKDTLPQTENIGYKIKRWLDRVVPENVGRGIELNGKVYVPLQSSTNASANDVVLIYNRNNNAFEGIWDLPAFSLQEFNSKYYYAESNGANVYQMFTDRFADVEGGDVYGYSFEAKTHFFNLTASRAYQQAIHGLVIDGYIRGGTTVTYEVWKDFNNDASITFQFSADEEGYLDGENSQFFLGDKPLGINGLTVDYSDIDEDGRRHFMFRTYFPFLYGNHFSVGVSSSGVDQDHETLSFGLMLNEEPAHNRNRIKSI